MSLLVSHCQLPAWLGLPAQEGGEYGLGRVKQALAERDVNSRGWRLYLDFGDSVFEPLKGPWIVANSGSKNGVFAAIWLRLLQQCEMDVPPPLELALSMRDWGFPGMGFGHTPPLFFRAAWKACLAAAYSGRALGDFVRSEIVPVAWWFFTSEAFRKIEAGQLKAGWNPLCRLRDEWAPAGPVEPAREEWPAFVGRVEWESWRFVAITNAADLTKEGRVMHHCIGSYANRCRKRGTRVYSVQDRATGKRIATLALQFDPTVAGGRWRLEDMRGPANEKVPSEVWYAAQAVERAFDETHPAWFRKVFSKQIAAGQLGPEDDDDLEFDDLP